ncbi:hypothetical protein GCM10009776_29380 [Microbacterium deminutum]|uniref:Uncharacterized protein n=1 Tax=Microbacterium deminutum TaxID=344164 RepID=A0ABN2R753_9MICO
MSAVNGSSLSRGESDELAELRRRAYGTSAGIADDPAAQARFHELENARRAPAPDPGPEQPDPSLAPTSDDGKSVPSR